MQKGINGYLRVFWHTQDILISYSSYNSIIVKIYPILRYKLNYKNFFPIGADDVINYLISVAVFEIFYEI
jgi:hypothetical protein